ncbi:hypothetical protein FS837_011899 [Tulasnella sp. UAMH 9824]|nr:hypothetical protein FS837_011899 [Tulasnella sp. UAMH 9824]
MAIDPSPGPPARSEEAGTALATVELKRSASSFKALIAKRNNNRLAFDPLSGEAPTGAAARPMSKAPSGSLKRKASSASTTSDNKQDSKRSNVFKPSAPLTFTFILIHDTSAVWNGAFRRPSKLGLAPLDAAGLVKQANFTAGVHLTEADIDRKVRTLFPHILSLSLATSSSSLTTPGSPEYIYNWVVLFPKRDGKAVLLSPSDTPADQEGNEISHSQPTLSDLTKATYYSSIRDAPDWLKGAVYIALAPSSAPNLSLNPRPGHPFDESSETTTSDTNNSHTDTTNSDHDDGDWHPRPGARPKSPSEEVSESSRPNPPSLRPSHQKVVVTPPAVVGLSPVPMVNPLDQNVTTQPTKYHLQVVKPTPTLAAKGPSTIPDSEVSSPVAAQAVALNYAMLKTIFDRLERTLFNIFEAYDTDIKIRQAVFPEYPDPGTPWEAILGVTMYLVDQTEQLLNADFNATAADTVFDYYSNNFTGCFFFLSFNVEAGSNEPSSKMAVFGEYGLPAFLPLFRNLIAVYKQVPQDTAASLQMMQSLPQKITRGQELVDWRLQQHPKWAFDSPEFWTLQNFLFTDPNALGVFEQTGSSLQHAPINTFMLPKMSAKDLATSIFHAFGSYNDWRKMNSSALVEGIHTFITTLVRPFLDVLSTDQVDYVEKRAVLGMFCNQAYWKAQEIVVNKKMPARQSLEPEINPLSSIKALERAPAMAALPSTGSTNQETMQVAVSSSNQPVEASQPAPQPRKPSAPKKMPSKPLPMTTRVTHSQDLPKRETAQVQTIPARRHQPTRAVRTAPAGQGPPHGSIAGELGDEEEDSASSRLSPESEDR